MQIPNELRGKMPQVERASPFASKDGRIKGWKINIPGGRPLATPALADGRIFIGGGFGSDEFYAFDALTGGLLWQYQTNDDGPTAAVVQDGFVAFNTECCELEVLTIEGRSVWKKWLGDPLMSMPAIDTGKVYQAYPDSRGDREHYLGCFDLKTGRQLWKQRIGGEVITAPVIAEGHVHVTTLDGTVYCFNQHDGSLLWEDAKNATSSPVVRNEKCYYSQREEVSLAAAGKGGGSRQWEHISACLKSNPSENHAYRKTARAADYLDHGKREARSPHYAAYTAADASVGFAFFKGDSKMHQARSNLGMGHVSSLWAYQGSKPFFANGRLYSSLGDTLHCVDPDSGEVFWKKPLHESGEKELLDSVVTPPALVNGKVFAGTIHGEVFALCAESGETLWKAEVGEPILFQPAVSGGRVYVPTRAGTLVALETGDPQDDGWLMWGANARHNGLTEY